MPDELKTNLQGIREPESREDDRRIPLVEEVFRNIVKAIKTISIYKHSKDRYIEFIEPAHRTLERFLVQYENLIVKVEPYSFKFLNAEVYKDTDQYSNISYRFFRDGVRRITFKKGLSINEFLQFILIISGQSQISRQADDTVSQLWLADLENIELTVIESGPSLTDGDSPDARSKEIETDTIVNFLERRLSTKGSDIIGFARISASDIGMELESVQTIKGLKDMPQIITAEQRQLIQEQFLSENEPTKIQKIRRILMAIIKSDLTDVETEDVIENFVLILDYLLLYDDLTKLVEFLKDIERESINTALTSMSRERLMRLRLRIQQELNTEIKTDRIIQILKSRKVEDPEQIRIIFDNFDANTYKKIPALIEQIDISDNLNIIFDILKRPRPHFEEVFLRLLNSKKINLVNLALDVIKGIECENKVESVKPLIHSQIPQISKKALEILAINGSDEAVDEIIKYLEEKKRQALDSVIHILHLLNEDTMANIILKLLTDASFNIDDSVRLLLMTRLAETITLPQSAAYFNAIFNEKARLFTRARVDEKKRIAIKALVNSPSIPTYQYLTSHLDNPNCSGEIKKEIATTAGLIKRRLQGG